MPESGHIYFADRLTGRLSIVSPAGRIVASASTTETADELCAKLDSVDNGTYSGNEL